MHLDCLLMRGVTDPELRVTFLADYTPDGKFSSIATVPPDRYKVFPSFCIKLSRAFDQYIFIKSTRYFSFVSVLKRSVKLISDNLYDLFPDMDKTEFEVDSRLMSIYQTEKAIASGGIVMSPCKWVNQTEECFPGIRIYSADTGEFRIPFDDAVLIVEMLSTFDPINMYMNLVQTFIK